MADNVTVDNGGLTDYTVATRKATYSGDANTDVQVVGVGLLTGSDDAKTMTDIAYTSSAALPIVDLGSGTNASGQVEISSTSATVVSSDTDRRGVLVINYQTVPIYIDPAGGTAATTNARLDPGASIYLPVTTAVTARTTNSYTAASNDYKVHYHTFAP